MSEEARRLAERAARISYGRLVAMLAARGNDIAAAEDALADALVAALDHWPRTGVPDNPDAWLFTAARRSMGQRRARRATAIQGEATIALLADERAEDAPTPFADDRLKLLFVCTHPAIDPAVQAPLMLQVVLGLDAARIAASFLVSPAAMGRRLTRAKTKIRDAGIAFAIPESEQLGARVGAVLDAIYAAYGTGWEDVLGADERSKGLAEEAIWLGRLIVDLLPDDPEPKGLLALMLHCQSRHAARRDADGGFVPLHAQNPRDWSAAMIAEAEALLREAARVAQPGRYQTEAAIQSLHAQTLMTGQPRPHALVALYDLLVAIAPSIGARVARAAAIAECGLAETALAELDRLGDAGRAYQPWWAARARVLRLLGDTDGARAAARQAAGMSADPAIRAHLLVNGDR